MEGKYAHHLYKHCADESKADAVAWCFTSVNKFEKFPYNQPALADDEVRAVVLYAGLCLSDSSTGRGKWGPAHYPLAPGHEIIGEVEQVGAKVTEFKKGDKVAFGTLRDCCDSCRYCKNNKEPLCIDTSLDRFTYGQHWGGYSTHLQQPAKFFFKIPENLDLKRAAPLLCAGITVYNPIKQYLKPGFKTAVIGIGGLGHLAVQFLAKMGHEVTAVTTTLDKENFIKSLGANSVITLNDQEILKNHLGQYDLIVNTVPATDNFQSYLSLLAKCGYMIQVGAPHYIEQISFSPNILVLNEYHIVGSLVGSRTDINEMLEFCAKNNIYPLCEEFNFEEFDQALNKLEKGKPIFRCVVNCGDYSKAKGLHK
jgi:D-arabinose 1-dehydrogenase-like Zn-dependent alcohol dehydrogenase